MPYDTASGSISTGCGLGGGVVLDGQRRPFELDEYLGSAAAVATQSVYSSGGPPAANPIPVATDAFRMTTTFADLFDRAAEYDVTVDAVGAALAERRSVSQGDADTSTEGGSNASDTDDLPPVDRDPSPARVVADADVLAADLFVGGPAREALDALRPHAWTTLVASDPLLDDAEAVIAALANDGLAADWREAVEAWREPVAQSAGDHPALASAYRGGAMQVVSLDPALTGPQAAAGLRDRMPVSVREPLAFATVFSPARLYPEAVGGEYSAPDRDPRSMESVGNSEDQHPDEDRHPGEDQHR